MAANIGSSGFASTILLIFSSGIFMNSVTWVRPLSIFFQYFTFRLINYLRSHELSKDPLINPNEIDMRADRRIIANS